jgi:hypothetical protein
LEVPLKTSTQEIFSKETLRGTRNSNGSISLKLSNPKIKDPLKGFAKKGTLFLEK